MSIIRNGQQLLERYRGTRAIAEVFRGTRSIWSSTPPPTINSFTANPPRIDLDTRLTGNLTLSFDVDNSTQNRIRNRDNGQNIPLTSSTTAIITQPLKPTTYVLTATNSRGSVSQEVFVDVTKNPAIMNLRRTSFVQTPGQNTYVYRFAFTVEGLPQPRVTYAFGDGRQGDVAHNYFRAGSNPYTWTVEFPITFGDSSARSLDLTAINGSGNARASLNNINS